MITHTTPEARTAALDGLLAFYMGRAADEFMATEFGGQFDENSVIVTADSFSARVDLPFTYEGIAFAVGTRVRFNKHGELDGVIFD